MAARTRWLAAVVLLVGGCAKPLEVASITEIKPVDGSSGTDVYAARRARGEQVPELSGDQLLEIRTYAERRGEPNVELAGATCSIKARDFSAEVETPGKVRMPLYRSQSSALSVSCSKDGYQTRMVTAEAFDETRSERYASGASGGLLGVAVVAAFDVMADNSKNDWRYPPVQVVLSPLQTAKN